jgi:hypothetical protein
MNTPKFIVRYQRRINITSLKTGRTQSKAQENQEVLPQKGKFFKS